MSAGSGKSGVSASAASASARISTSAASKFGAVARGQGRRPGRPLRHRGGGQAVRVGGVDLRRRSRPRRRSRAGSPRPSRRRPAARRWRRGRRRRPRRGGRSRRRRGGSGPWRRLRRGSSGRIAWSGFWWRCRKRRKALHASASLRSHIAWGGVRRREPPARGPLSRGPLRGHAGARPGLGFLSAQRARSPPGTGCLCAIRPGSGPDPRPPEVAGHAAPGRFPQRYCRPPDE